MNLKIHSYRYDVTLPPFPTIVMVKHGRWLLRIEPLHWELNLDGEDWPHEWPEKGFAHPVFRHWAAGPWKLWRFEARS